MIAGPSLFVSTMVYGARRRRHIPVMGILFFILLFAVGILVYIFFSRPVAQEPAQAEPLAVPVARSPVIPESDASYLVQEGDTLADIFADFEVPYNEIVLLEQASRDVFPFTRLQPGKTVHVTFAPAEAVYRLDEVWFMPDEERIVRAKQTLTGWQCEVEKFVFEVRRSGKQGTVEASLYQSGLEAGLPEGVIIDFADQFAWDMDFARDTRTGDTYKVVYEEKWREGAFVKAGKVLAAEYVNRGQTFRAFYFKVDGEERGGYFNEKGEALQRAFLKAPVNFRYVSSGFTNARFHPILGKVMPHDGVDYAANYGVPIIAVGDGVVTKMAWTGGYGNRIEVRHNERYGSQYSHMSAYVKGMRVGDRVKQGETVGYVGSTGFSTGNHVHFSITEYGSYVDPTTVDAPKGKAVAPEHQEAFAVTVAEQLSALEEIGV